MGTWSKPYPPAWGPRSSQATAHPRRAGVCRFAPQKARLRDPHRHPRFLVPSLTRSGDGCLSHAREAWTVVCTTEISPQDAGVIGSPPVRDGEPASTRPFVGSAFEMGTRGKASTKSSQRRLCTSSGQGHLEDRAPVNRRAAPPASPLPLGGAAASFSLALNPRSP